MTRFSLFRTAAPAVALQVTSRFVSGLALVRQAGGPMVAGHAVEPLPAGAVVPTLTGRNVSDRQAATQAVARVLGQLAGRSRRVVLVLPDCVAKVSLVRLDTVPARAEDLDRLIRWHVRKSAPFPVDDAQVAYSPGAIVAEGGREFVVALARRDIVREYEEVCEAAGVHAGLVDLATFSLVNAVLAIAGTLSGDNLLVHLTPDYGSMAILRGQDLIFFRSRAEGSDESLPDLVHQTAMYYEDRLAGAGFARVLVAGSGGDGRAAASAPAFEAVRRQIEARLGVKAETVEPQRFARFSDRIAADAALANMMAPLVGALAGAGA